MGDAALVKDQLLIAFVHDLPASVVEDIRAKFPNAEITIIHLERLAPIPSEYARKATIIVTFTNLPNIEDSANIKLIHTLSAGVDHLLTHPILKDSKIPISTSSGIHGPPIAEWTVLNWLAASKEFVRTYENQKQHVWGDVDEYMQGLHDQVGKKVGILGYGSIGRQIGRVAVALGMTVHAYTASPRLTSESRRDTGYIIPGTGDKDGSIPASWHHGTDKASIHSFLKLGLDHLVVCVPLTAQTHHLLGAEEFAVLSSHIPAGHPKPYLTNIARGKVIDQEALIASLQSGELSGAALDVTDPEPLPADHPLWDVPNVRISPHISALGKEYFPRSFDIAKENIWRLERGEPLVNEYKRTRGY
ncbi:hypothetical protein CNMCM7691_002691 [Aspergillus felis]|uniref:D-isomer specific 2-hydroxyacid dehydrogenase NAD-binding domain-containing protein n=1 Tax=Aspergillus felis TaxID=1287682 RepID=A0A8H6R3D4_9EURO|nr:hypothetical protein CNMCM7691_002691 [Aspergillus felis]